jgi:hypothetical protein
MSSHKFDKDYFEHGVEKGISLYENYRWMPEVSLPIANYVKQLYTHSKILDYGCAKGFLVYALRLLSVDAYGYDTSKYAIDNCIPEVKQYLFRTKAVIPPVNVIFIKDVLEHFGYNIIDAELQWMSEHCLNMLAVVPLGEDGTYRIPEYGFDKTHIIKENEVWWINKFKQNGFIVDEFVYQIDFIKKKWHDHHPYGNAFFFLSSQYSPRR